MKVVDLLEKNKLIFNKVWHLSSSCKEYAVGTLDKLTFSYVFIATSPLEVLHVDVWGPAIKSSG